ncbi:MAG: ATP-dependent helicase C-terminal domain-containing protein, partial [Bryobacteraceae bacterium]
EQPWRPRVRRLHEQIRREARVGTSDPEADEALLISVLVAFPDRVARRRRERDLLLASGGAAILAPSSLVREAEFLVAVDVEERREHGLPLVRLASAIRPEWLLDLFPERVREQEQMEWNRAAERVERISSLLYDELVIEQSTGPARGPEAERLLAERALEAGPNRFADPAEIEAFCARLEFAAAWAPVPVPGKEDIAAALVSLCRGVASFGELAAVVRSGGLIRALEARLPEKMRRQLERIAPARLRLPSGRTVPVHYARGQPPWIEAKIQELFGLRETPRLAGGKAPVTVRLLAPNNRPVQTTTDLEGFWRRLYPDLRRELGRRYPRHDWPEDPLAAPPSFR